MRLFAAILLALLVTSCSATGSLSREATSSADTPAVSATTTDTPDSVLITTPTAIVLSTLTPTAEIPTSTPQPTQTPAPTETQPSGVTSPPNPDEYSWNLVVDGLELPLGIVRSVDGTGRLFILEQAGKVRVVRDGQRLETPFLDIVAKVGCCGERGLLGMAFHPQFSQNGFVYIHYSDLNGDTIISRYEVSPDNPNQLDLTSEREILSLAQPYRNHNGGEISFGPDGYLYIGLGDGGSAGDPQGNGQSTQTLLGKILRIDVDGGDPYAIPADNPLAEGGGLPEIWAYGLRNPWRFFFDPLNGELYIGDVGQNEWEEINYLPPGSQGGVNFGWNYLEGTHPFRGSPPSDLVLTNPVAEYNHDLGCSVTGGVVYRGERLPEWRGVYLYGDYCSGNVWGLWRDAQSAWNSALLFRTGFNISAFGIDDSGEVYLSDYGGAIYRLER